MNKNATPPFLRILLCLFLMPIGIIAQSNWSNPDSWPSGQVPRQNESVVIPEGQTILLDMDTPSLGSLEIHGELRFVDRDVRLTARWIMVHGLLQIGTAETPFQNRATITLTGPEEDINTMGGRFLIAMHGGQLEFHGASAQKLSWAQLSKSTAAGDTQLELDQVPIGWTAGDKIAIAPSGYDAFETEERTISRVEGRTVTITPALQFAHFGELQEYEGKILDERAEVGLLNRNIKIQGASDAFEKNYGGHIMIMHSAGPVHVEGVEFTAMGQPGLEARYNFHWHLAGEREGDYLRNSSVHHSLQRAVVVHQTDFVLIENVVAYNIRNHAFIPAEDGNEVDNTFKNNLALLIQNPEKGFFAFPKDDGKTSTQGEQRSSGFWMRNPHNNIIGNHVGGVERGNGFFIDTRGRSRDFKDFDLLPRDVVFDGNVAHSCAVPGNLGNEGVSNVAMYGKVGFGHGIFMNTFQNGELMWTLNNYTGYKNMMSGVWTEITNVTLDNFILADNSIGLLSSESHVSNTLVIGKTRNTIGGPNRNLRHGDRRAGYYTIAQGGSKEPKLSNVTFIDINKDIEPDKVAAAVIGNGGHKEANFFREIKIVGDTQPIWMSTRGNKGRNENSSMLLDEDGSLSGYDRPVLIAHPYSALKKDAIAYHKEWQAYILEAEGALQLRIGNIGFDLPQEVSLIRDFDQLRIPKMQFSKQRYFNFFGSQRYTVRGQWEMEDKGNSMQLRSVLGKEGEWSIFKFPMPYTETQVLDRNEQPITALQHLAELDGQEANAYYFNPDEGAIYLKMVTGSDGLAKVTIIPQGRNTGTNFGLEVGSEAQFFNDVKVYPNPLDDNSKLEYTLLQTETLSIDLYDVLGRNIGNLYSGKQDSGPHSIPLDNLRLGSGVYVLGIRVGDASVSRKVIKP
ncbi:G8 domain-containing protein [Flagellimonas sp. DF-77]|uniref:G8 domain-containing protein n=1 Tax=Flagellimonas algarum TaxID=3230298 RepID=UPI003391735C